MRRVSSDRPFQLLIVGIQWPPETFIMRLIRGLTQRGVEVTIASPQRAEGGPEFCGRLHWLPIPFSAGGGFLETLASLARISGAAMRYPAGMRPYVRFALQGERLVHRYRRLRQFAPFAGLKPDVVYFPWNMAAISYLPLFDLDIPVVLSCRGAQVNVAPLNPHRTHLRDGLTETFARARAVHCVSEDILQAAIEYGLDPARARVIRPSIDPSRFCPKGEHAERNDGLFRVISTGRVIWPKGQEYALLAIRKLVDQGVPVRFDLIGDGEDRERIVYTIRDMELQDHVVAHGKLDPNAVIRLLQEADAFLLSSLTEGISNATLEAMGCGLPVVITDCGGMREVVDDGAEGFIVPVRDASAMADRLQRLAADQELRARMGRAGRERIVRELTLDQQLEHWLDLYRSIGVMQ